MKTQCVLLALNHSNFCSGLSSSKPHKVAFRQKVFIKTKSLGLPWWLSGQESAREPTLTAESKDEGKRGECGKNQLKTQHSKTKEHGIGSHSFMAKRWRNNGNSDRLYFRGSKIPVGVDCSRGIKRRLLLGRKAMIDLDSIWKSRDTALPTLWVVCLVKATVFPVVTMDVRLGP